MAFLGALQNSAATAIALDNRPIPGALQLGGSRHQANTVTVRSCRNLFGLLEWKRRPCAVELLWRSDAVR